MPHIITKLLCPAWQVTFCPTLCNLLIGGKQTNAHLLISINKQHYYFLKKRGKEVSHRQVNETFQLLSGRGEREMRKD